ncbi:hypothetical protein HPB49_011231 [Dermacentor silvarum]|uniref:Uncharacterized protein n=1 Tax=Dermacentor silvarum TaxID=543639 RepID=A0ACB8C377_DERSI|nr:hypothetical protein HPB49_011231 [Dermacentor silvarum]
MGNTNSALITFAGMHVPFSVYYQRLEFRCRPHKPRAHHCTICLQYEHRTCACPGNQRLCPTCSTPISQPDEPHSCSPWCLHCQGHHTPFAEICPVRMQRDEACANAAKKQRLLHRQQWKSLNTSQPPVKPSSPSSIPKVRASSSLLPTHAQWGGQHPRLTQVSPTPVIQPAPSAQPKPAEYHTPAPVKQESPLQKPVHQVRSPTTPAPAPTTSPSPCRVEQLELGLTELTSRVTTLTSLVEMQQKRIEAQDQRTSNLETLISNLTQSLDNLNSTINKAFNDAPGPMEDKNHPFKRTHPIPAAEGSLASMEKKRNNRVAARGNKEDRVEDEESEYRDDQADKVEQLQATVERLDSELRNTKEQLQQTQDCLDSARMVKRLEHILDKAEGGEDSRVSVVSAPKISKELTCVPCISMDCPLKISTGGST